MGSDFETFVPRVGRAMITVTMSSVFWNLGGFEQLAGGLDNASAAHTYRLAAEASGTAQVFRDGKLLAVRPTGDAPDPLIGTKGADIEWGGGAGSSEADAVVAGVAYNTTGAYRP